MCRRTCFIFTALILFFSLVLTAQVNPEQPSAGGGTESSAKASEPADTSSGESAGVAVQGDKPAEVTASRVTETTVQGNKLADAPFSNADVIKLNKLGLGDDVVIAKINEVRRVNFQVATDDLISLKEQGVSSGVISAMIRRSSSAVKGGGYVDTPMGAVAVPGMGSGPSVRLDTTEGQFELASIGGHMGSTYAFFTVLLYMDYPGLHADERTKDKHPSILVTSPKNPAGRYYLAKCDVNDGDGTRSVKMGKSGAFTSSGYGAPDSDWVINFSAKEEQPGLWRLVPVKDLKPGEYGVWGPSQELFDFGVDK